MHPFLDYNHDTLLADLQDLRRVIPTAGPDFTRWIAARVESVLETNQGFILTVFDDQSSGAAARCLFRVETTHELNGLCENFIDWRALAGDEAALLLRPAAGEFEFEVQAVDRFWADKAAALAYRDGLRYLAGKGRARNQQHLSDPVGIKSVGLICDVRDAEIEAIKYTVAGMLAPEMTIVPADADFAAHYGAPSSVWQRFDELAQVHETSHPVDLIMVLNSGNSPSYPILTGPLAERITQSTVPVIVGVPRGSCRSLVHATAFEARDSVLGALITLRHLLGGKVHPEDRIELTMWA